jgi:hypothetical protein
MIYANSNLAESMRLIKSSFSEMEALIIRAEAGFFATIGLANYYNDTFNTLLFSYHVSYGLKTLNKTEFCQTIGFKFFLFPFYRFKSKNFPVSSKEGANRILGSIRA